MEVATGRVEEEEVRVRVRRSKEEGVGRRETILGYTGIGCPLASFPKCSSGLIEDTSC